MTLVRPDEILCVYCNIVTCALHWLFRSGEIRRLDSTTDAEAAQQAAAAAGAAASESATESSLRLSETIAGSAGHGRSLAGDEGVEELK